MARERQTRFINMGKARGNKQEGDATKSQANHEVDKLNALRGANKRTPTSTHAHAGITKIFLYKRYTW